MARQVAKLNALAVDRAKNPGLYSDGDGLYLKVTPSGSKSWVLRYMRDGQRRAMGLGSVRVRSLSEARIAAQKALNGLKASELRTDPIEARKAERAAQEADKAAQAREIANARTFDECAAEYIKGKRATGEWKNAKHAAQWESTLKRHVSPVFGHLSVKDVNRDLVEQALVPIWLKIPETASRVRNRIELILDWAMAKEYRPEGRNPARWRGHLDKLFPKRSDVQRVKHLAALPFPDLPDFLSRLRREPDRVPAALEFLILTATRTSEVLGARWDEIDFDAGVWTIPASRMKAKREHRVPLSSRATEILLKVRADSNGTFIFPGRPSKSGERPLSNMAFLAVLRRMECEVTAHGFRSTFRDWAGERTDFPQEVAEMALAHAVKDKVEAAYRRGDFFEKRRRMMNAWAAFCMESPAKPASITSILARAKS